MLYGSGIIKINGGKMSDISDEQFAEKNMSRELQERADRIINELLESLKPLKEEIIYRKNLIEKKPK
jgi:hypothetical protein